MYYDENSETFPERWTNPLELFGRSIDELLTSGQDLEFEQVNAQDLVERHGARWVWDNRLRLAPMVKALKAAERRIG